MRKIKIDTERKRQRKYERIKKRKRGANSGAQGLVQDDKRQETKTGIPQRAFTSDVIEIVSFERCSNRNSNVNF